MSTITDWASAHVASASKRDLEVSMFATMLAGIGFFAMAFSGENSTLQFSLADLHAFVKQCLESVL